MIPLQMIKEERHLALHKMIPLQMIKEERHLAFPLCFYTKSGANAPLSHYKLLYNCKTKSLYCPATSRGAIILILPSNVVSQAKKVLLTRTVGLIR